MQEIIILSGAPGAGKSTIASLLHQKYNIPVICFGKLNITEFTNDPLSEKSATQKMSLSILIKAIESYQEFKLTPVVIHDVRDDQLQTMANHFKDASCSIFTLYCTNEDILASRTLDETRDSSCRDVPYALEWNRAIQVRNTLPNEIKINTTDHTPSQTLELILKHM